MKVTNTVKALSPDNPTMNDDYFLTASHNDCTGLTPTIAHNEYEAVSYNEIAHYLPPVNTLGKGDHRLTNTHLYDKK